MRPTKQPAAAPFARSRWWRPLRSRWASGQSFPNTMPKGWTHLHLKSMTKSMRKDGVVMPPSADKRLTNHRTMHHNGFNTMPTDDQPNEHQVARDATTLFDELKRVLSFNTVKRSFQLGTELFDAASPFLDKPTWWNAAKAAFSMGKVLAEDVEVNCEDFFDNSDWAEPYNADFNMTIAHTLRKFPFERVKRSHDGDDDETYVRLVTLPNGVKAGWIVDGEKKGVDHLYVEAVRLNEGRECIKQLLWEQFKGKSLVMHKNNRIILNGAEDRIIFEVDNAFESKLSRKAQDYAEYLKRPLSAGVPRSIMFYGPPGTGKSTLARTIIELMSLRSFRIRINDLSGLDSTTLFEAISIFEPDAVILDDFDRAEAQSQLLETLEYFQQKVKLVITTVNNRNMLDEALLRPGRIDELVLVDRMDDEVIKHVLGDYADGFDLVKDWPIAFVQEYVVRRRYLTTVEAADSVKELAERVQGLSHYCDDDDDGMRRMWKLMAKKRGRRPVQNTDDDDDDGSDDVVVGD